MSTPPPAPAGGLISQLTAEILGRESANGNMAETLVQGFLERDLVHGRAPSFPADLVADAQRDMSTREVTQNDRALVASAIEQLREADPSSPAVSLLRLILILSKERKKTSLRTQLAQPSAGQPRPAAPETRPAVLRTSTSPVFLRNGTIPAEDLAASILYSLTGADSLLIVFDAQKEFENGGCLIKGTTPAEIPAAYSRGALPLLLPHAMMATEVTYAGYLTRRLRLMIQEYREAAQYTQHQRQRLERGSHCAEALCDAALDLIEQYQAQARSQVVRFAHQMKLCSESASVEYALAALCRNSGGLALHTLQGAARRVAVALKSVYRVLEAVARPEPLTGGRLLSALHVLAQDGGGVGRVAGAFLRAASVPLAGILRTWLLTGELPARSRTTARRAQPVQLTTEFFIIDCAYRAPEDSLTPELVSAESWQLWHTRYRVVPAHRMAFLGSQCELAIYNAGRALSFLRHACGQQHYQLPPALIRRVEALQLSRPGTELEATTREIERLAWERIRAVLLRDHSMLTHFAAIHNLVLLADSGFSSALSEQLGEQIRQLWSRLDLHQFSTELHLVVTRFTPSLADLVADRAAVAGGEDEAVLGFVRECVDVSCPQAPMPSAYRTEDEYQQAVRAYDDACQHPVMTTFGISYRVDRLGPIGVCFSPRDVATLRGLARQFWLLRNCECWLTNAADSLRHMHRAFLRRPLFTDPNDKRYNGSVQAAREVVAAASRVRKRFTDVVGQISDFVASVTVASWVRFARDVAASQSVDELCAAVQAYFAHMAAANFESEAPTASLGPREVLSLQEQAEARLRELAFDASAASAAPQTEAQRRYGDAVRVLQRSMRMLLHQVYACSYGIHQFASSLADGKDSLDRRLGGREAGSGDAGEPYTLLNQICDAEDKMLTSLRSKEKVLEDAFADLRSALRKVLLEAPQPAASTLNNRLRQPGDEITSIQEKAERDARLRQPRA